MTGTAAAPPHGNSAGTPPGRGTAAWPTAVVPVIAILTVLGLALRTYLAVRPGLMAITQYDDGAYFGSAVRLADGVLPYRDFAFVQPPGITLLMAPVGLVAHVTGTAWGMVIARLLTVVAGAASVVLAGLLARHRGVLAVVVTCGILATYPPSAAAAHTVLLEPWVVLFCLAGAVAVFDGDRLAARTSRLAWGGAALGFACAVKLWAVVPVVVIFVLCLPRLRRAAVFAGAAAGGFLVPVLPFALLAPGKFYDSVIVAQAARIGARVSLPLRLKEMLGVLGGPTWEQDTALLAIIGLVVFVAGAQLAASVITRSRPAPLDWFATLSAALVIAIFLWPPYFASHYAAFLAPFLGLAIALAAARLVAVARPAAWPRAIRMLGVPLAGVAVLAFTAGAVFQAQPRTEPPGIPPALPSAADSVIPAGACVLTDSASYLLLANRFVSGVPGCPQMVDALGTDLALSRGRRPGTGAAAVPAVAAAWHRAFQRAQYLLLSTKNELRIAWSPALRTYFRRHFRPVMRKRDFTVYVRESPRRGGP